MVVGAVILDCDGVLVDSEVISIAQEVAALSSVGVRLSFTDVVDRYLGLSDESMRAAVDEEFGVHLDDAFWVGLRERTHLALAEQARAVDGMAALVADLTAPYCLASSSSHERLRTTLSAAGLLQLFGDEIRFSADDVDHGKPAPDLFLHAARALGVAPDRCVVVEDAPSGVQAARAANMRPIGFAGGGHADAAWAQRLRDAGAEVVALDAAQLRVALNSWLVSY